MAPARYGFGVLAIMAGLVLTAPPASAQGSTPAIAPLSGQPVSAGAQAGSTQAGSTQAGLTQAGPPPARVTAAPRPAPSVNVLGVHVQADAPVSPSYAGTAYKTLAGQPETGQDAIAGQVMQPDDSSPR